jgi:uncharacterized protein (TIGR00288 family)
VIENLSRRGTADAYPAPLRHAPNAALLIDFDNVTMGIRSDLQLQLKRLLSSEVFKGKISVQRAYADWRRYPQYIVPLSEASIDLIFAPAFGSNKKNATDIRLAIDALELVFTRQEIGTYILLSGDSDFSSLVLKLKEYGKYVIGVGIRESSSDLLIQNCDEYFSYNELTGLLKEGEVEQRRQDPWALVVEAVTRMQRANDIMRSDRLKQVMQEIDPTFSEKDAGFSKYSKFLQEASRRGLLRLAKLENGQYEIVLGTNANVPIDVERELDRPEREAPPPRRRGGRGRGAAAPAVPATPATVAEGLPLSEAFALLRRALTEIGAVGEESTDADQTRERMAELAGGDDPLFETRRFQRFLRQAHDADMIDLVKSDDGAYLLRLRPDAPAVEADAGAEPEPDGERGRRRRGERGGRSRRGSRRRRGDDESAPVTDTEGPEAPRTPAAHRAPAEEPAIAVPDTVPEAAATAPGGAHRNPRFRHGSRGGHAPKPEPRRAPEAPPTEPAVTGPVSHNRSLRGRGGRRGAGPAGPRPPETPVPAPAPAPEMEPAPAAAAPRDGLVEPPARPAPPVRAEPREPAPAADTRADAGESGGLFKRMSAALQRAMLGQPKDEPPSDS